MLIKYSIILPAPPACNTVDQIHVQTVLGFQPSALLREDLNNYLSAAGRSVGTERARRADRNDCSPWYSVRGCQSFNNSVAARYLRLCCHAAAFDGRTGPLYWSWAAYLCLCLAVRATIDQINLSTVLIDHLVIYMLSLRARVVAAYHNNRDLTWEQAECFMSLIHYVLVCSTGSSLISLTAQECFYTLINPSKS